MQAPVKAKFRQTVQGGEYRFMPANKTAERWVAVNGLTNGLRASEACQWLRSGQIIWEE